MNGIEPKDEPGRFEYIPKSRLRIDDTYQRTLSATRVSRIAREWSWISLEVITVAARKDGSLFVVNGQHRVAAAMKRDDVEVLPCLIFECDEISEEARAFVEVNTSRRAMESAHRFKAQVIALDPLSVKINSVFLNLGMTPSGSAKGTAQISCLAACYEVARRNFEEFELTLSRAYQLAHPENKVVSEPLLMGLNYLHRYSTRLNDPDFWARLRHVGVERLLSGAKRLATIHNRGWARNWAAGMLEEINKNLRHKYELRLD